MPEQDLEQEAVSAPEESPAEEALTPEPTSTNQISFLDPDFLLFAMPFALLIDIMDVVLQLGIFVNLILGAPLIMWMMARAGQTIDVQDFRKNQAAKKASKAAVKSAFRKGLLVFILELIPIVSVFFFWTITIFLTLRSNSSVPASEERDTMAPNGKPLPSPQHAT